MNAVLGRVVPLPGDTNFIIIIIISSSSIIIIVATTIFYFAAASISATPRSRQKTAFSRAQRRALVGPARRRCVECLRRNDTYTRALRARCRPLVRYRSIRISPSNSNNSSSHSNDNNYRRAAVGGRGFASALACQPGLGWKRGARRPQDRLRFDAPLSIGQGVCARCPKTANGPGGVRAARPCSPLLLFENDKAAGSRPQAKGSRAHPPWRPREMRAPAEP